MYTQCCFHVKNQHQMSTIYCESNVVFHFAFYQFDEYDYNMLRFPDEFRAPNGD